MKGLKSKRNAYLASALTLTILMVASIPGIVFSAIYDLWLPLTLSIIFAVAGFYVMPILWVKFGEIKQPMRVLEAIEIENLYTTEEIASQLQTKEKTIVAHINYLLRNRFLQGYKFDGKNIILNENIKQVKTIKTVKCSYCGANVKVDATTNICPYCNAHMTISKH